MRVRSSHCTSTILEDLHPSVLFAKLDELVMPQLDHGFELLLRHLSQG